MPDQVSAMGLSPMPPAKGRQRLNKVAGGTAAAALIVAMIGGFEGKRNDPYFDLIHVQTVCYGETRVEMRHYTDAECEDMLANGAADFAGPVLKRNPELLGHANQIAAATSLAYNVGAANYAGSTVAKRFSAGNWRGACDAFLSWRFAGGREIAGLKRRREAERALCLRGL